MPRTRHHSCWTGSPLTVACDWLTVCVKISGFVKVCTLSIWIRYVTAFDASVQSKVIGCATVAWLAGDSRLGVPGVGGGAGGPTVMVGNRITLSSWAVSCTVV